MYRGGCSHHHRILAATISHELSIFESARKTEELPPEIDTLHRSVYNEHLKFTEGAVLNMSSHSSLPSIHCLYSKRLGTRVQAPVTTYTKPKKAAKLPMKTSSGILSYFLCGDRLGSEKGVPAEDSLNPHD